MAEEDEVPVEERLRNHMDAHAENLRNEVDKIHDALHRVETGAARDRNLIRTNADEMIERMDKLTSMMHHTIKQNEKRHSRKPRVRPDDLLFSGGDDPDDCDDDDAGYSSGDGDRHVKKAKETMAMLRALALALEKNDDDIHHHRHRHRHHHPHHDTTPPLTMAQQFAAAQHQRMNLFDKTIDSITELKRIMGELNERVTDIEMSAYAHGGNGSGAGTIQRGHGGPPLDVEEQFSVMNTINFGIMRQEVEIERRLDQLKSQDHNAWRSVVNGNARYIDDDTYDPETYKTYKSTFESATKAMEDLKKAVDRYKDPRHPEEVIVPPSLFKMFDAKASRFSEAGEELTKLLNKLLGENKTWKFNPALAYHMTCNGEKMPAVVQKWYDKGYNPEDPPPAAGKNRTKWVSRRVLCQLPDLLDKARQVASETLLAANQYATGVPTVLGRAAAKMAGLYDGIHEKVQEVFYKGLSLKGKYKVALIKGGFVCIGIPTEGDDDEDEEDGSASSVPTAAAQRAHLNDVLGLAGRERTAAYAAQRAHLNDVLGLAGRERTAAYAAQRAATAAADLAREASRQSLPRRLFGESRLVRAWEITRLRQVVVTAAMFAFGTALAVAAMNSSNAGAVQDDDMSSNTDIINATAGTILENAMEDPAVASQAAAYSTNPSMVPNLMESINGTLTGSEILGAAVFSYIRQGIIPTRIPEPRSTIIELENDTDAGTDIGGSDSSTAEIVTPPDWVPETVFFPDQRTMNDSVSSSAATLKQCYTELTGNSIPVRSAVDGVAEGFEQMCLANASDIIRDIQTQTLTLDEKNKRFEKRFYSDTSTQLAVWKKAWTDIRLDFSQGQGALLGQRDGWRFTHHPILLGGNFDIDTSGHIRADEGNAPTETAPAPAPPLVFGQPASTSTAVVTGAAGAAAIIGRGLKMAELIMIKLDLADGGIKDITKLFCGPNLIYNSDLKPMGNIDLTVKAAAANRGAAGTQVISTLPKGGGIRIGFATIGEMFTMVRNIVFFATDTNTAISGILGVVTLFQAHQIGTGAAAAAGAPVGAVGDVVGIGVRIRSMQRNAGRPNLGGMNDVYEWNYKR